MGDTGLEQTPKTPGETALPDCSAADALQFEAEDARLQAIINAWPGLSESVKSELLRVVENAVRETS